MTKEKIKEIFYRQMEKDFCCKKEDLFTGNNVFVQRELLEGRRRFRSDEALLRVLCINGKAVYSAEANLLEKCRSAFIEKNNAWFSDFNNLKEIDALLRERGQYLSYFHHFYLPLGKEALSEEELDKLQQQYEIIWYEKEDIEAFRGDGRFRNAYSFLENAPDMLGVSASLNGQILGMSGASRDSEEMWQIGIDVLPESRGRQIGPLLTILLKREILKRGKLPFYGTAESHIQSQKVAVKSGFLPAWAELQSDNLA